MVPGLLVTHGTYPLRIRVTYVFISVCAGYLLTYLPLPSTLTRGLTLCVLYMYVMFNYFGAVLFGVTMGFTSLIPLTAVNNQIAMRDCFKQSDTHTLVTVRAFAGTTNHCVDNRYL